MCTPPFGAEQLHVYAKQEPFPYFAPGETYEEDGYVYLTPTRGFQPLKSQPEGSAHILLPLYQSKTYIHRSKVHYYIVVTNRRGVCPAPWHVSKPYKTNVYSIYKKNIVISIFRLSL